MTFLIIQKLSCEQNKSFPSAFLYKTLGEHGASGIFPEQSSTLTLTQGVCAFPIFSLSRPILPVIHPGPPPLRSTPQLQRPYELLVA